MGIFGCFLGKGRSRPGVRNAGPRDLWGEPGLRSGDKTPKPLEPGLTRGSGQLRTRGCPKIIRKTPKFGGSRTRFRPKAGDRAPPLATPPPRSSPRPRCRATAPGRDGASVVSDRERRQSQRCGRGVRMACPPSLGSPRESRGVGGDMQILVKRMLMRGLRGNTGRGGNTGDTKRDTGRGGEVRGTREL